MPHSDTGAARAAPHVHDRLLQEVLAGLRAAQPTLPCKLFYDARGSALYDRITELDEYYPYAAEVALLGAHAPAIARQLGDAPLVIEYGSGSSIKTRLLLDALDTCAGYVPVDISREHLLAASRDIARDYPRIPVEPVVADFTGPIRLPQRFADHDARVAFFPGSTIGNFAPDDATALLGHIRDAVGDRGRLLIGVDIPKDRATLELAYDDPHGVTAAFNRNILDHVNRLFDADFDVDSFRHEAIWNDAASRIEMHLRCTRAQRVTIAGEVFEYREGDSLWTESSHKYRPEALLAIAAPAGFAPEALWFDPQQRYSMHLLRAAS